MPPPKKAAKKASAKHADPKHHEMKDLRRAYEHLGRVELIQKVSGHTEKDVSTLAALAQKELQAGRANNAADLLRAAEHFSFAALGASAAKASVLSEELKEAVQDEFDHLTEKAQNHWEHEEEKYRHGEVITLHSKALEEAKHAFKQGAYRQALELARGAEALAHVQKHGPDELESANNHLKLGTS